MRNKTANELDNLFFFFQMILLSPNHMFMIRHPESWIQFFHLAAYKITIWCIATLEWQTGSHFTQISL